MNFVVRNNYGSQHLDFRGTSTHPLDTDIAEHMGTESAVVRYRRLLARIQIRRLRLRDRRCTVRLCDLRCGNDIPEKSLPMPKCIKLLMYNGVPLGARSMRDANGDSYFKFNGLKESQCVAVALYLLSIPVADRRDILETMMLNCRGWMMCRVSEEYCKAAANIQRKKIARMSAGHALVCDMAGVLH